MDNSSGAFSGIEVSVTSIFRRDGTLARARTKLNAIRCISPTVKMVILSPMIP